MHYGFAFCLDRLGLLHMNQASPININNISLKSSQVLGMYACSRTFRVIDIRRARSFRLPFWARACT